MTVDFGRPVLAAKSSSAWSSSGERLMESFVTAIGIGMTTVMPQ